MPCYQVQTGGGRSQVPWRCSRVDPSREKHTDCELHGHRGTLNQAGHTSPRTLLPVRKERERERVWGASGCEPNSLNHTPTGSIHICVEQWGTLPEIEEKSMSPRSSMSHLKMYQQDISECACMFIITGADSRGWVKRVHCHPSLLWLCA